VVSDLAGRSERTWTVPNALSVVRILLTPVFLLALWQGRPDVAWVLFVAAGVSDGLDGILARILRQRSVLGAMLDPIADKVLLVSAFAGLAAKGWLPVWIAALVAARDVFILGGIALLRKRGVDVKSRISPVWASKCNTVAQILLVFFVVGGHAFAVEVPDSARLALVHAVAVLSVVSGAQYVGEGFRLLCGRSGE
jgi:cardiolipin synthase